MYTQQPFNPNYYFIYQKKTQREQMIEDERLIRVMQEMHVSQQRQNRYRSEGTTTKDSESGSGYQEGDGTPKKQSAPADSSDRSETEQGNRYAHTDQAGKGHSAQKGSNQRSVNQPNGQGSQPGMPGMNNGYPQGNNQYSQTGSNEMYPQGNNQYSQTGSNEMPGMNNVYPQGNNQYAQTGSNEMPGFPAGFQQNMPGMFGNQQPMYGSSGYQQGNNMYHNGQNSAQFGSVNQPNVHFNQQGMPGMNNVYPQGNTQYSQTGSNEMPGMNNVYPQGNNQYAQTGSNEMPGFPAGFQQNMPGMFGNQQPMYGSSGYQQGNNMYNNQQNINPVSPNGYHGQINAMMNGYPQNQEDFFHDMSSAMFDPTKKTKKTESYSSESSSSDEDSYDVQDKKREKELKSQKRKLDKLTSELNQVRKDGEETAFINQLHLQVNPVALKKESKRLQKEIALETQKYNDLLSQKNLPDIL
eukprot:TRINITY_DN1599_c0_g1_i5.p1 TRINITY_DN1599_c0_g1~~TRINITY_DN1599_c0_g1_i5.p1  ORF type:complete len:467 (+),score=101.11 TRINITY_DN1599_c0_g1_i5:94-1494(+)